MKNKLGGLGGLIGLLIGVAAIVFASSGTLKGWVFSKAWDEKSALECGGSQHITIRDKKIKMDKGPVFEVGGSCELEVNDSDIIAPSVLSAGGSAHIVFQGGSITASESAMSVGGNAQIEVHGTKIVGEITKGGSARITGMPDLDKQQSTEDAQKALDDKWGHSACDGIAECYRKSGFVGQAAARVIGEVNADGSVDSVEIKGTPGEQRDCVESTMKAKKVEAYDGGHGQLICEFSGTWAAGNEDLNIGGGFHR